MITSNSLGPRSNESRRLAARVRAAESLLRALMLALAFATVSQVAAAESSHRPRVYAGASLIEGLIATPVPNYPAEAAKKGWVGLGVFELYFRPDGTVQSMATVLTTGHQLLGRHSARRSLALAPQAGHSKRWPDDDVVFRTRRSRQVESVDRKGAEECPGAPLPTYPLAARRERLAGRGLFVMRFRLDGRKLWR